MKKHTSAAPRLFGGAALIALILSACSSTTVFDLKPGDCVNFPSSGFTDESEVTSVKKVECSEEHDAQIVGEFDSKATEFPGMEALEGEAQEFCPGAFEQFVGIPLGESSLDLYPLTPTEDSWNKADDRKIQCMAVDPSGRVSESFEGSKK